MSLLRRPLTQLELCEDDVRWMTERIDEKVVKALSSSNETSKKDESIDKNVIFEDADGEAMETEGSPMLTSQPTDYTRTPSNTADPVVTTPQNAVSLSTPINETTVPPPPPNVRVTRAQARSRVSSIQQVPACTLYEQFDSDIRFREIERTPVQEDTQAREDQEPSSSVSNNIDRRIE